MYNTVTIQYNKIQCDAVQYYKTIQLVSFNAVFTVSFFRKVLNLGRESVFLIVFVLAFGRCRLLLVLVL